ncbi:MAG: DUF2972 domain-containing protein [Helicobacter sp.]|nr:DUF2972 domain-containing protein [Helicobacter sp.]
MTPSVEGLSYVLRRELNFTYASSIKSFLNPSYNIKIHYLDTKELMPEYAFETMTRLAKEFHFTPPKEEDKQSFEKLIWNKFQLYLPFELAITPKDFATLKENINLKIIESQYLKDYQNTDWADIKEFFIGENTPLYADISIIVKSKDTKIISENAKLKTRLSEYFREFMKALEYWVNFKEQNQITEKQVLDYLKKNKKLRLKLKKNLDKELVHIKQSRPDIVATWKYYKEFEKICKGD